MVVELRRLDLHFVRRTGRLHEFRRRRAGGRRGHQDLRVTDTVYQVFEILGFPSLFDIVADRQAAVSGIPKRPRKEN